MHFRALLAIAAAALAGMSADAPLATRLADTGLFETGSNGRVRAENAPFDPGYPLWTDGRAKRRWIHVPADKAIDKSNPDAWEFPSGTKAWKEFSDANGRIETRLIERLRDGSWRYSTYAWNAEGSEAELAPDEGVPARGIPSRADCRACHEGAPVPILGYSAVQLDSTIGDPLLGYLHGNCGHCHNPEALPAAGLHLAQSSVDPNGSARRARASLAGRGEPVLARLRSDNPYFRMPPLGVRVADATAIASIERWIGHDLRQPQEKKP